MIGVLAAAGYWATRSVEAPDIQLWPDDTATVARGAVIYAANCAACHGANLEGQPNWIERDAEGYLPAPPHDKDGHTWHHTDKLLFKLTKEGVASIVGSDYKTRMPAYDGVLSDEEIIAVLSFIKSRWPQEIRKRNDNINKSAQGG